MVTAHIETIYMAMINQQRPNQWYLIQPMINCCCIMPLFKTSLQTTFLFSPTAMMCPLGYKKQLTAAQHFLIKGRPFCHVFFHQSIIFSFHWSILPLQIIILFFYPQHDCVVDHLALLGKTLPLLEIKRKAMNRWFVFIIP